MKSNLRVGQKELCKMLFEIGAIKFGDFTLKLHDKNPNAPLSPIYVDLRMVPRFPKVFGAVVREYLYLVKGLRCDVLAGIPIAASPFTGAISYLSGIGMITPRMETKTHGTGAKIDGIMESDAEDSIIAALVDDLVTKADSKIEAAEILRAAGFVVADVVVLIDRNQGGRQQLAASGLVLHSVLLLDDMLIYYLESGQISDTVYQNTVSRLNLLSQFTN